MTLELVIKEKAEKYAREALITSDNYSHLYNGYVQGYQEAIDDMQKKDNKQLRDILWGNSK